MTTKRALKSQARPGRVVNYTRSWPLTTKKQSYMNKSKTADHRPVIGERHPTSTAVCPSKEGPADFEDLWPTTFQNKIYFGLPPCPPNSLYLGDLGPTAFQNQINFRPPPSHIPRPQIYLILGTWGRQPPKIK